MSKYLKNYNKTIDEYKNYLSNITSRSRDEFYKRGKDYFAKLAIFIDKINRIFPNAYVTDELLKSLDEMYTLKDISKPSFDEELRKVFPLLKTYPELSISFIKELLPFYNSRMFEELNLFEELSMAIQTKDDAAFESVMTKAILGKLNYDMKWENDSILDLYKDRYSEEYIEYLKSKAKERYIDYSSIMLSIPSEELVSMDEAKVKSINTIYDINIIPFSYDLTILNAEMDDLTIYNNDLYYDTPDEQVKASFTIKDYVDDIRRVKIYK